MMLTVRGVVLVAAVGWSAALAREPAPPLGKIALVGDSITQGGSTPSYRYFFWKALVDAGLEHGRDYTFVGSQTGFYAGGKQALAADHGGQAFPNVHEGHWGWRSSWLAAAAPLPKGRHGAKNLGAGTVATWTGKAKTYVTADKGELPYAGPVAVPDTVVLMIGVNDLSDGTPAVQVAGHVRTIVGLYQAANPAVRVHVCSVLPVGGKHAKAASMNPQVKALDDLLARQARAWSTKTSRVDFVDLRPGFDATRMTYDSVHPNEAGEAVMAANLAKALGIAAAKDDAKPESPARRPAKAASFKPQAKEVDVYVLTGQSNMLGTTAAGDGKADPGDDPADAATRIFWSNVSSSNDAWPPKLHGDSGGAFVPLAVQQGDGGTNPTFWGPEFGLARELAARGGRDVAIVKACRGGGGNSLWDKAAFDRDPAAGHMWGHLRDTLEAALDALAEEDAKPRVRGFCYLQGESNSEAEAKAAGERLATLARNVTAVIEKKAPGATRGMRVAVAEIAASRSNARRTTTTTAQQAICQWAPNAAFVPTADLPLKSDGLHFGGVEKLEIGRRLAAALVPAAKAVPAGR